MQYFLSIIFCSLLFNITSAQTIELRGTVKDVDGNGVSGVGIYTNPREFSNGTISDNSGQFRLQIKTNNQKVITVEFMHIAFQKKSIRIQTALGKNQQLNITMDEMTNILDSTEILVNPSNNYNVSETKIDPKNTLMLPSGSGNTVTDLLKTLPNVTSNNELSSQYSVKGGNYDENLIYVNDFEIYRPLLISNSQQEGLSFINPDLTQSISFNAGGFEAKYGDKMSSVLNIRYKRPTKFGGSAMLSLLGASAHLEGITKDKKLSFLFGLRYKSNAYLLGSLDKKGEYNPNFLDIQTNIIYQPSKKTEVELLLGLSNNKFSFTPESQSTTTGAFNQVLRLSVFFDGSEKSYFNNRMGGLAFKFKPNSKSIYKLVGSAWQLNESENYNIIGEYYLDEIESNFDSDNFGKVKNNLGIGTFQDWTRNTLKGNIFNLGLRNSHILQNHTLEWGASVQHESFNDQISEWERIDSAGFSIPYTGQHPEIINRLKSKIELNSWRYQAYVQDDWQILSGKNKLSVNGGLRFHYWDVNQQFIVSPRLQIYFKPNTKKDVSIKMSGGLYAQPPLYRELRNFEGYINPEVRAQKAYQFVLGSELNFQLWNRNFKFTSEAYYKHLLDLIPYQIEDVKIRYFANNEAKGYAAGLGIRIFGEFVKGTDSWVSLSVMKTAEDILNDYYYKYYNKSGELISSMSQDQIPTDSSIVNPGYIRRPTDQRFNMSIFFQDYLVKNKNFKMHLQLHLGTGLPFGTPDKKRYNDVFKMPPYRRVDIGFSYLLVDGDKKYKSGFFNNFDKIWLSAEVLNLLGVQNTLSYRWVKDVRNTVWPLPNYLTSRRINVKLYVSF
ncbi:MAG TPA: carboxypeptidase-like regulatory domain-containing protein [Chitinophagales bacterium]|nr:carboxypeptidase-like regulatory domain-containing protein [Chitinophagales bacterium]